MIFGRRKGKVKTLNNGTGCDLTDIEIQIMDLDLETYLVYGVFLGRLERKSKWSPVLRGARPYIARARA